MNTNGGAHRPGCTCLACSIAHVSRPEMAPRARFALECACGNNELSRLGPFGDDDSGDVGLRWVLACGRCGEQIRIYQTSPAWRDERARRTTPVVEVTERYTGPSTIGVGKDDKGSGEGSA